MHFSPSPGPTRISRATEPTLAIDGKAKLWTVSRGADARLEERLDPAFDTEGANYPIDEVIDALISASAEQDVAETRLW